MSSSGPLAELRDDVAPPRANGELIFDAPWQSRVFGLTAAMVEQSALSWAEMQDALISQVGAADANDRDTGEPAIYWDCWLTAFGAVAMAGNLLTEPQWSGLCAKLATREPGHDH